MEKIKKNFNFSSLKKEKWENQMHCYPHVIKFKKNLYMFYNGNNYGKSGIGLAKLNLE